MVDKMTTNELLNEMHERCLMPTAKDPKRFAKAKALEVAIEALKLHTPTKPNWQGDEKCMDAYCPNCGTYLDDGETPCDGCTQLIDWSDEE